MDEDRYDFDAEELADTAAMFGEDQDEDEYDRD